MEYVLIKQSWWSIFIAGYLFLGGMGGMMFIAAAYWWLKRRDKIMAFFGSLSAALMMIVGIGLLILDLTRPKAAMLVLLSPRLNLHSWITIGTMIISVYTVLLLIYTAQFFPGLRRLPWYKITRIMDIIAIVAVFFGIATATYTGLLLSAARAVGFWATPILPLLFVFSGLSTGYCWYCLLLGPIVYLTGGGHSEAGRIRVWLQKIDVVSLLVELALIFALIANGLVSGNPAAVESAKTLLYGEYSLLLWGVIVVAGILVPLAIMLAYTLRTEEETAPIVIASSIAALLVLIGGFTLRYLVLEVGYIMVPIP
ncbi:MAG: NrfD/PsrC family molybdoenzyme membrane anchor subunit [Pyrodictiaceae archaeon]